MKIILALDLYDTSILKNPNIFKELSHWCKDVKVEVQPVYVHSSSLLTELVMSQVEDIYKEVLEKIKPFKKLKVLQLPLEVRKKEIEDGLTLSA